MSARASLSTRDLKDALAFIEPAAAELPFAPRWLLRLRAAVRPSEKKRAAKKERAGKKRAEWSAHGAETSEIYAAVEKRADGDCEACRQPFSFLDPPELDHQAGRGRARQTVENCWLIHRESCHRARTDGVGGARRHLERFIAHCERNGYRAEAERARSRLEGIVTARERYAEAKGAR